MVKQVGTIDVTPTWRGILPILIAGIEDGTPEGRRIAIEELYRMADFVDKANVMPEPLGPDENIGSIKPD